MLVRMFRRSTAKSAQQAQSAASTAAKPVKAAPLVVEMPKKVRSVDPDVFIEQHSMLDSLEQRLQELQARKPVRISDGLEPSTGRVNEVDLASMIDLTEGDDSEFERRFAAFTSAGDLTDRSWID